ncbi:hypothetical protein HZS_1408 [Henneguya salminicola]|nr:hypothetical protein HZS_1408 [Henneguya salminicola]
MPIFQRPETIRFAIDLLSKKINEKHWKFDYIAALEARGFLFGVPLALEFDCGFIPIRKKSKLPGPIIDIHSTKEYGEV